jgi:hypothetical protein
MHRPNELNPPVSGVAFAGRPDRSATATLRATQSADRLTVHYPGPSFDTELACGDRVVWSGRWEWEVRCDGAPVPPVSSWRSTCRFADKDADYLELAVTLAGGFELQRHLVLARKDRFLLLADAVLGPAPGRIEYRMSLPLAPKVAFRGAHETREGFLVLGRSLARVLPLALPEWRCDSPSGELASDSGRLQLSQSTPGRRMFAPLLFDLDAGRFRRRVTWRQLTVVESLRVQPPDVAVGYRVTVGREHWLIYRSLAGKAGRTLVGHNLATETLVARFVDGEVESIAEVE